MWKECLKEYFVFTKKERIGIILLLTGIFTLTILPVFFPIFSKGDSIDHSGFEQEIEAFIQDSSHRITIVAKDTEFENDYSYGEGNHEKKRSEFYFDPNTASLNDWIRLGVKERTAATVLKYVSKGGRFYKPEDLQKIYGLSKKDAERLTPYVKIESIAKLTDFISYEKNSYPEKEKKDFKSKKIPAININTADTLTFALLPGIGNRLANRVVNFRNKLGGFHSVDQVGETYLLPDSTFQKIKPYLFLEKMEIQRININQATVDELKVHPYIRYQVANAIFQYRARHGKYMSIEDLKKIMIVTDSIFTKIAPYISTSD